MARKRNYRAEYKRRIARGRARGLSRAVAAGHPETKTVKDRKTGKNRKVRIGIGIAAAKVATKKARAKGFNVKFPTTAKEFKRFVARDARYVFGKKPKRGFEDGSAPEYQLRLEQLASRPGVFDWKSEAKFIAEMMALGISERQAYSHWFSPGGASV